MLLCMQTKARNRSKLIPPSLARLPPLTSLRAFVATARHLSFARAAEELHVTSAAIGQQIRLLEDHLGQPLFLRNRGQLALTGAGQVLMPGLTDAFDRVLEAVSRLAGDSDNEPIRISVAPSFASKWLVPRLAALRQTLPDLEVLVDASARFADLNNDETDCVIRYGLGTYPGLVTDKLFGEAVVPICSPAFAREHGLYAGPRALANVPLLHEDGPEHDNFCPGWADWLRSVGVRDLDYGPGFRFNQSSLIIDAAIAGQGLGLGKLRLAAADIAAGRLVVPFGEPQPVEFAYFFAATPLKASQPRIARFREWLNAEAASARSIGLPYVHPTAHSIVSEVAAE